MRRHLNWLSRPWLAPCRSAARRSGECRPKTAWQDDSARILVVGKGSWGTSVGVGHRHGVPSIAKLSSANCKGDATALSAGTATDFIPLPEYSPRSDRGIITQCQGRSPSPKAFIRAAQHPTVANFTNNPARRMSVPFSGSPGGARRNLLKIPIISKFFHNFKILRIPPVNKAGPCGSAAGPLEALIGASLA